jgi:Mg2+/Co2+ transporter CorB
MSWFVLVLCLAASFLFSGTEAGILSLNKLRLRHLARQRDRAAVHLQQVLEQPAHLLVTVLIVTSLLNILALVLLWLERLLSNASRCASPLPLGG